ncbi:Protein fam13a [Sparganum proliferum]
MHRVVQNFNSPNLKRRTDVEDARNFGVPLRCLVNLPSVNIPRIVTNICDFLLKYGLCVEGIFRVNGSSKKICSLKALLDVSPDFSLTSSYVHDIHAICGIFKLFLREIPDGLVPALPTKSIVKVMDRFKDDKFRCTERLIMILDSLAEENYTLLKYICDFLRKFLTQESVNKMPASNLGIVFGPCVFKCSTGVQGLREQSLSNVAMTHFIVYYNEIFATHTPRRSKCRRDLKDESNLSSVQPASSLECFQTQCRHEPPVSSQRELHDGRRPQKNPQTFMCLPNIHLSNEELSAKSSAQNATDRPSPLSRLVSSPYGEFSTQHTQSVGSLLDPALSRSSECKRPPASDRTPSPRQAHPPSTGTTPNKTFYSAKVTPGSKDSLCVRSDSMPNASDTDSVSSHGFLARELVTIMASISIPNILKTSMISADVGSVSDDATAADTAASAAASVRSYNLEISPESASTPSTSPLAFSSPANQVRKFHWQRYDGDDGADVEDVQSYLSTSSMPSLVAGCRRRRHTTEGVGVLRGLPHDRLTGPSSAYPPASKPVFTKQWTSGQQRQPNSTMYADPNHSSGYLTSQRPTESDLMTDQVAGEPPSAHDSFTGNGNTGLVKPYNFATVKQSALQPEELLPYSDSPTPVNASLETVLDGLCNAEATFEPSIQVLGSPLILRQASVTGIRLDCRSTLQRERNCRSVCTALFVTSGNVQPDRLRLTRSLPYCLSGFAVEGLDFAPSRHNGTTSAPGICTDQPARRSSENVQNSETLDEMALEFQKPIDVFEPATADTSTSETLERFLNLLLAVLERQRLRRGRPENIEELTPRQLIQEKADLQKSLLYFEKVHGRPSDPTERRIMKPLYDRYRHVRRLVRCMQNSNRTKSLSLYRSEDNAVSAALTTSTHSYTPVAGPPVKGDSPCHPSAPEVINLEVQACDTVKVDLEADESSAVDACASESTLKNLSKTEVPELAAGMVLDTSSSLLNFAESLTRYPKEKLPSILLSIQSRKHKLQRLLRDFEQQIWLLKHKPPSKSDRDQRRSEYSSYRTLKQHLFIVEKMIESPELSAEELAALAQPIGRCHRKKQPNGSPAQTVDTFSSPQPIPYTEERLKPFESPTHPQSDCYSAWSSPSPFLP